VSTWSRAAMLAAACLSFPAAFVTAAAHPAVSTSSGPAFGVAEDASKFADDGGATIYASLENAGMTENRWTVTFDGDPSTIGDQPFLDRSVPAAASAGVDVIMSLFPAH